MITNYLLKSDTFDIPINRQESFNIEVRRILKPIGIFITQQAGEKK